MADNKDLIFNIGLNSEDFTKGLDKVKDGFSKVSEKTQSLGAVANETSQSLLKSFKGAPFFKDFDDAVGGIGKEIVNLGVAGLEAAKTIKIGAGIIKAALISTGIGAIVVALGLVAANWDSIKETVTGVNGELTRSIVKIEAQASAQERIVKNLNNSDNILKLQGKTQSQINSLKINELNILISQKRLLLENQLIAVKGAEEAQKAWGEFITSLVKGLNAPINFFIRGFGIAIDSVVEKLNAIPGVDIKFSGKNLADDAVAGIEKIQNKIISTITPDLTSKLNDSIKETEDQLIGLENTVAGLKLENIAIERSSNEPLFSKDYLSNISNGLTSLKSIPPVIKDVEGNLATLPANIGSNIQLLLDNTTALFEDFRAVAQESLGGILSNVGATLGEALASGTSVIQAVGSTLLQALGGLASQLGDLFIQYAITAGVFGKALAGIASGNPATIAASAGILLAAGLALKVIGGAISSSASGGGASGGGGGGADGFSGGGNVSTSSQFSGGGGGKVVFEIAGTKLIGVLNNTSRATARTGGGETLD